MIKPTIGRKLWFWRTKEQFEAAQAANQDHSTTGRIDEQPEDATIVAVWNPTLLNLQVIDHHGVARAETSVQLLQEGDLIPPSRFATWMPFQVGQSKLLQDKVQAMAATS